MLKKSLLINILVLLLICVCLNHCKKPLAFYIKPCSKTTPDFEECCLAHGKEALQYIIKGDKEYKLPILTPVEIPLVSLDSGSFKITVKDVKVYGFNTSELKQVKFDFDNKEVTVKIYFAELNIIGAYELDGKLLMIPLQGTGKSNITVVGVDVIYSVIYDFETKEGEEYFRVASATSDFNCDMVYLDLDDILGTNDKELDITMNKAMNENWREYLDTLKPVITETIVQIGNAIINGFGSTVPFEDIFLD